MTSIENTKQTPYILHICHSYYDPFLDCARQYAVLFKDTPYKVITVFLSGEPDPLVAEKACSDEVIFLNYKSKQLSGLKLGIIRKIHQLAKQYNFVACIAHRAKPTYIAALATHLPILSIRHSFGDFDRPGRRFLVNFFKSRLTLLAVSNAVRDEIRGHLPDWPEEKIQTLYNRIDVELVQSELLPKPEARAKLNLSMDDWIVGSVGRIHPDKDPQTLIRGFAKALPSLPENAKLCLIGKGKLEAELKTLVLALDIDNHVLFLGSVAEARRYFKAFDVFALSSDREPFGMVLLEAMAADLPIICTDCGGGAEIIDGIGQLFKFRDIDALSDALIKTANVETSIANKQAINSRLETLFSDSAVKQAFWSNSRISRLLNA
ncbi:MULTISPECIES: glycosyltransferase [unclassified Methylophaga]|uniref:glycosyltransferase n=2 Tax=Methylophaga TaxID=40222 RepID=UPI000C89B108|nr:MULTISPECIES: glycosyltransferase [unclassified Methylophaga]MBN46576.1 glycosyl transferase [Methylophaga sp.]|tara:strand:- start:38441 stop:39574 length:1134 start_codon:yes stop_codon:yes gene_type:complete